MCHATATIDAPGTLDDIAIEEIAELLVYVDANYGRTPFWQSVRETGLRGAYNQLSVQAHDYLAHVAVRDNDQLIAFGALVPSPEHPDTLELRSVMVHPDHRRHGHGRTVLEALLHHPVTYNQHVHLVVRADGEEAITLYRSTGFAVTGYNLGTRTGRLLLTMCRAADAPCPAICPPGP